MAGNRQNTGLASYIPLTGASGITGNLAFANSGTAMRGIQGVMGDNDCWHVMGGTTAANAGYLELATCDDGTEPIYVRQYSGGGTGSFTNLVRTLTLLDANGNTTLPGNLNMSGQVMRAGQNKSWYQGRDGALVRVTSQGANNQYIPALSMKTVNGSWELGPYTDDDVYLTYITDANYNSGTNSPTAQYRFGKGGRLYLNSLETPGEVISKASNAFRAIYWNYGVIIHQPPVQLVV